MTRRTVRASMIAFVLLLFVPPGVAQARPVTFTDVQKSLTETFVDVAPCNEDLGLYDITITYNAVFHVTAAGIDGGDFVPPYHVTGTTTGRFSALPHEDGAPTFSGRFTQWFDENSNTANGNGTFTFSVRGWGSDGSRFVFTEVAHFGVTASGAELEFDKPHCH